MEIDNNILTLDSLCCLLKSDSIRRIMNILSKSIANLTKSYMNITKHLLSNPEFKERNVVLSPLSLQTTLSMVTAGSEGPTQRQLLSFLGSESVQHLNSLSSHLVSHVLKDAAPAGGPSLSSAYAIWVEKTLSLYPSFKETIATNYKATLQSHDFINKVSCFIFISSLEL